MKKWWIFLLCFFFWQFECFSSSWNFFYSSLNWFEFEMVECNFWELVWCNREKGLCFWMLSEVIYGEFEKCTWRWSGCERLRLLSFTIFLSNFKQKWGNSSLNILQTLILYQNGTNSNRSCLQEALMVLKNASQAFSTLDIFTLPIHLP